MIKCECICAECKKNIQAWQDEFGKVVPGMLTFDFINKRITYVCPNCGHVNILELGSIDEAVKKRKALPRIRSSNF